jgi:lysophospholipase L1-like esterase
MAACQMTVAEPLKVACVGDSITYGHGVKSRARKSYPAQLQVMLGKDYVVKNFGRSGASVQKDAKRSYWDVPQFGAVQKWQPDIIVIKLGTNDACQDNGNWKGKEPFKKAYLDLLTVFKGIPSKPKLYLCTPAPSLPGDPGRREVVMKPVVIPAIKEIAEEQGVEVIDIYSAMSDKAFLFSDKIHPNARGLQLLADEVFKGITD